jgi:hypothetical protein
MLDTQAHCTEQPNNLPDAATVCLQLLVVLEGSSAGVDGSEQQQANQGQEASLRLPQRDSSLQVELGQGALSGDGLSQEGGSKAELGQAADKQLILLGEACTEKDQVSTSGTL